MWRIRSEQVHTQNVSFGEGGGGLRAGLEGIYNLCLILKLCYKNQWTGISQQLQRPVTGWTVRGSNSGGGEILCALPDRPWGPPSLLYNGYWVFPGGKAAGVCVDQPPHLAPRLKKEWSYTSTPPLDLHGHFQGELYSMLKNHIMIINCNVTRLVNAFIYIKM